MKKLGSLTTTSARNLLSEARWKWGWFITGPQGNPLMWGTFPVLVRCVTCFSIVGDGHQSMFIDFIGINRYVTYTHTHTYIYIYVYVYIHIYICQWHLHTFTPSVIRYEKHGLHSRLQIAKESVPRSWSPGPAPTRGWLTTAACVRSLTSAGHICWQTWRIFQAWWLVESSPHPLNMQMWSPPQPTSPYEGPEAPWSSLGKDNEVLTRRAIRLCMTWRTGVLRRREASANLFTFCWAEDVFTIHDCQEDLVKPSVNRTIVFGVYSAHCVCCLFPPEFPATTAPNSIPVSSRVQACSAVYMYSMYSLFNYLHPCLLHLLGCWISLIFFPRSIPGIYYIYIYAVHIHAYTRTCSHHTFVFDVPRH